MKSQLIYLASPYSSNSKDPVTKLEVQQKRFEEICHVTASLLKQGYHVYSPIVHCHALATKFNMPKDWAYWKKHLEVVIPHFDALWVIKMDGWESSVGIKAEVELARNLGLEVRMIDPEDVYANDFETKVVNFHTQKFDVYIGRGGGGENGEWGNYHTIGWCKLCEVVHTRSDAIAAFKKDFLYVLEHDPDYRKRVKALKGKRLGCFCAPLPCHGDVYREWLDNPANA